MHTMMLLNRFCAEKDTFSAKKFPGMCKPFKLGKDFVACNGISMVIVHDKGIPGFDIKDFDQAIMPRKGGIEDIIEKIFTAVRTDNWTLLKIHDIEPPQWRKSWCDECLAAGCDDCNGLGYEFYPKEDDTYTFSRYGKDTVVAKEHLFLLFGVPSLRYRTSTINDGITKNAPILNISFDGGMAGIMGIKR